MTDIIKLSEQEILEYAEQEEGFLFASESDYLAIANIVLEQVNAKYRAQLLTQQEPVAKVLFRKDDDGLEPIIFYSNDEYPKNKELKDRFMVMDVYLSPPDTQQKLDKARDAMIAFYNHVDGICPTGWRNDDVWDSFEQALKDTE